jgi:hypothetical protein
MTGFAKLASRMLARRFFWIVTPLLLSAGLVVSADAQEKPNQTALGVAPSTPATLLTPPVPLVPQSGDLNNPRGVRSSDIVPEGSIAVRELDEVSSDSLGLTDALTGGLSVDMWSGTPKELVDVLLPKLPARVSSEASRSLMRQLLLSVARPPEPARVEDVFVDMSALVPSSTGFIHNADADAGLVENMGAIDLETIADLGILERRVAQLALMGDWRNVRALIELVPAPAATESILQVRTDLALVEGGVDVACAEAGERLSLSNAPYWQKVFAFCQLSDGNVSGAFLTIDLLRELGTDDQAFFWAAEIMSGNRPITPNGLRRLSPLQLAMLRGAGRPLPSQLVSDGDPTLLRVLAEAEPLFIAGDDDDEVIVEERLRRALEDRLRAAERAVSLGALDPEVLRNLYRAEMFAEDIVAGDSVTESLAQRQNDQALGKTLATNTAVDDLDLNDFPVDTVLARARLFKLAEAQSIPTARAEVISRAIDFARADRGRRGPDVATMGRIFSSLLKEMAPAGDLDWFAGNAARALLAAGELEASRDWLALTQLYARTSIEAADVAAAMWPIERQFQPTFRNRFTPLRLKRWEESRPSGRISGDKTLVLSTLGSLGEAVTNDDWFDLMGNQSRRSTEIPSPQIWNGLIDASHNGRLGETVLIALVALGEDGLSSISPIVLSHVISALVQVGLENEARRLAVEAAIIQGL